MNKKSWYLDTKKNFYVHGLDNKQILEYLFSNHYSKSSLINHYTSYGSMNFVIHVLNQIIQRKDLQKVFAQSSHTEGNPSLPKTISFLRTIVHVVYYVFPVPEQIELIALYISTSNELHGTL